MKKTISKNTGGLMLIATLALVITSCRKEQNVGLKSSSSDADAVSSISIPDSLQVPAGNTLLLQAFARGVQIYQVKRSANDPNVFVWVNIAPLATLYTKPNFTDHIIDHFAGPSWEFVKGPQKGEKVVAAKVQGVTPDPTAIQWLLLKAVDSLSTPGNQITFVQRISTVGGLAPTTGADEAHLGQTDSIPYKASYLFYVKQ
jgi:hypothetical protein